jgi:dTDP-glucose 4,6-dehydratase
MAVREGGYPIRMRKTVLITGGAGFIGSHFTEYLLEQYPDYEVRVLDALTYAGRRENLAGSGGQSALQFHSRRCAR